MVSAFATWLCRPSRAIFVQADGTVAHFCTHVGIEQGCPASPAAYALAARRATDLSLAHLHEAGYPTARAFAYMDDTSVILPAGGQTSPCKLQRSRSLPSASPSTPASAPSSCRPMRRSHWVQRTTFGWRRHARTGCRSVERP